MTLPNPTTSHDKALAQKPNWARRVVPKALRRFLRHRLAVFGLTALFTLTLTAAFAPQLAPYPPNQLDLSLVLRPPGGAHPFGTDELGRDLLSRLIYGSRTPLLIVALSLLGAAVVGSLVGLVAGTLGGRWDSVIMRITDGLLTFPSLVLVLAIVAVLGPNLLNAVLALAVSGAPAFARLVRGEALNVRNLEFVEAARALGASTTRIAVKHIWPNVTGVVVVNASLRASGILISESSLSFLGLGAQPPAPTWGSMVAAGINYWTHAWWMSFFPGLAIFITVLALNFVGDALRDAIDVRTST